MFKLGVGYQDKGINVYVGRGMLKIVKTPFNMWSFKRYWYSPKNLEHCTKEDIVKDTIFIGILINSMK